MAIVNHFYNRTTPKYIAIFGSLFNKIAIEREKNGVTENRQVVPISYGPYQKFLARIVQDPELNRKQAVSLPRMSFEMTSMMPDLQRKLQSTNQFRSSLSDDNTLGTHLYSGAPYNLEFNLYIMTKYAEDGTKIIEQILPFFKPEWTSTVKLMEGLEPIDVPLVLNSVQAEDIYEGDFITRRSLMWTLSFTMKAWFFGPIRDRKVIKFIDVRHFDDMDPNKLHKIKTTIQPGLTSNGEPTSDENDSIPYLDIDFEDDWGVITLTEEEIDE